MIDMVYELDKCNKKTVWKFTIQDGIPYAIILLDGISECKINLKGHIEIRSCDTCKNDKCAKFMFNSDSIEMVELPLLRFTYLMNPFSSWEIEHLIAITEYDNKLIAVDLGPDSHPIHLGYLHQGFYGNGGM